MGLSAADKISSTIKNGFFSIRVDLKDGERPEDNVNDIKDIVAKIQTNLPSDMDEPIVKTMKHAFPLITVAVYSKDGSDSKRVFNRNCQKSKI